MATTVKVWGGVVTVKVWGRSGHRDDSLRSQDSYWQLISKKDVFDLPCMFCVEHLISNNSTPLLYFSVEASTANTYNVLTRRLTSI